MGSSSQKVDLIVFGASGFTGKFVVKELVALQSHEDFTFGIAGRNLSKLHNVLSDVYDDKPDATKIPVIEANVNDPASLLKMAQSARVVINCVGPYRFYGEAVVNACVAAGTDYVDITGEPQFIEKMYLKYDQKAVAKNVAIISTCGFDSIPADIGALFTVSQFDSDMKPSGMESFIEVENSKGPVRGHFATFESAVHGFANQHELVKLRREINYPKLNATGPKLPKHVLPYFDKRLNKWALPFPGSDASVVRRTQLALSGEENFSPSQYNAYFTVSSLVNVFVVLVFSIIF